LYFQNPEHSASISFVSIVRRFEINIRTRTPRRFGDWLKAGGYGGNQFVPEEMLFDILILASQVSGHKDGTNT